MEPDESSRTDWDKYGFKIGKFKCFGEQPQGFDRFKLINILVGKNNSGKSTILDAIEFATIDSDYTNNFNRCFDKKGLERTCLFQYEKLLDEHEYQFASKNGIDLSGCSEPIKMIFHQREGGHIKLDTIGNTSISAAKVFNNSLSNATNAMVGQLVLDADSVSHNLERSFISPLKGRMYFKLNAERDIKIETENNGFNDLVDNLAKYNVGSDGGGIVNVINRFCNYKDLPSCVVDREIVTYFNDICRPVVPVEKIATQIFVKNGERLLELTLFDKFNRAIGIGHSGSGLRTVILVLSFLHLLPMSKENFELRGSVFAIEEPENNMHPEMLRRLLKHIAEFAITNDMPVFIATHSSVAIDMFMNDENAQIIHVKHDGQFATCSTVGGFSDGKGVLDDIGAKASDLLQANGLIWVEGPSDAIYINHWIRLWSNGELRQGRDYQCVFYGGRLLAHLAGEVKDTPEEDQKLINTIMINPNAIYLMDSDNKNDSDEINPTKTRIIGEAERSACFAWVTDGREIENYIPRKGASALLAISFDRECGQYERFSDYLEEFAPGRGKRFSDTKVVMATLICEKLPEKSDWEGSPGLDEKMKEVIAKIEKWNN